MEPVGKSCSLLILVTTLLSQTWGAPDKELLCGGKILKDTWGWHLVRGIGYLCGTSFKKLYEDVCLKFKEEGSLGGPLFTDTGFPTL